MNSAISYFDWVVMSVTSKSENSRLLFLAREYNQVFKSEKKKVEMTNLG